MRDKSRFHLIWGGAGSGKSRFQAQKCVLALLGEVFDRSYRAICLRKEEKYVKESCYREILTVIENEGIRNQFNITKSPMYIQHKGTKNEVLFAGLNDVARLKSFSEPTDIWVEEAMEITKKDLIQLNLRIRGVEDGQITLTFNPEYSSHCIPQMFPKLKDMQMGKLYEGENWLGLRTDFTHNLFAGDQYTQQMEWLKKHDPEGYEIYALAQWGGKDKPNQLIKSKYIMRAINEIEHEKGKQRAGVDVARYGDDSSVFGKFSGNVFDLIEEYQNQSLPETQRRAFVFISNNSIDPRRVGIDTVGYGASVYDFLHEKKMEVKSIESGGSPVETYQNEVYKFANLRSQMWWYVMERFVNGKLAIDLPEQQQQTLFEDLTAVKYIIDDKKVKVQSKDKLKEELGRSPDYGDAFVYGDFVPKIQQESWVMWG